MEKYRHPWIPPNPRASHGAALWNPSGKVRRVSQSLYLILMTNPGKAARASHRDGNTGASTEDMTGCHSQGTSLGTTPHLATIRNKSSCEKAEGLDPSCPTFSWARACIYSHQNTPALSSLTGVSSLCPWQLPG